MPPESDWHRMTSFLQYEGFGETVLRQAGDEAGELPVVLSASRLNQPAAEAPAAGGHGAPAKSSQSLLEEDGELLDLLARPAPGPSPGRSVEELRAQAAALAAENESLALRLEPLRQQVGHRLGASKRHRCG